MEAAGAPRQRGRGDTHCDRQQHPRAEGNCGLYCASAGASVVTGFGAELAAGAAAGVAAIASRAVVRFGAARFPLVALARPRVGFLAAADLPRRAAVVRRAAAVLRFVDPRLPAFLILVVFPFDFRAVLAMASSPLVGLICYSVASVWCLAMR